MKKVMLLILTVIMLLGLSALAQEDKYMRANVPFSFSVGDKVMPAGTYEIWVTDNTRIVQMKNIETKDVAMLEVMTRLAKYPKNKENTLTFDVIGDKHVLETYWPRMDDGFLLHVTPEAHTHKIVKVA